MIRLECPGVAEGARPGQFALLRSSLPGMPLLSRPFSFYGADRRRGLVEFLIKEVGPATQLLCSQPPGSEMLIVGPLGRGFTAPEGEEVLLVGGGTGVAPLAFFAETMAGGMPTRAIIGAPSAKYLLARDRFLEAGLALTVVTEDGTEGERGLPTEVLAERLSEGAREGECPAEKAGILCPHSAGTPNSKLETPDPGALPPPSSANAPATGGTTRNLEPETRNPSNQTMDPPSCWADSKSVLACGPSPMLAEVARICREAGVECEVSLENQLGCGVGACYGCVVPVLGDDAPSGWARVCTDGPVFPAARIDWKRMETLLSAP